MSSFGTTLITSSSFDTSPLTMPAIALAAIPLSPPVLGTVTHIAFLTMLPLHSTSTLSGIQPRTSLALAAAKAIAIGSVQPIAGTSSSLNIFI